MNKFLNGIFGDEKFSKDLKLSYFDFSEESGNSEVCLTICHVTTILMLEIFQSDTLLSAVNHVKFLFSAAKTRYSIFYDFY